jgi:hypothetical protein
LLGGGRNISGSVMHDGWACKNYLWGRVLLGR